jgi:4-hydroxybenzoate polyprenyltransferase
LTRLSKLGDAIMVRHTLFSLPWALGALLLVSAGRPTAVQAVAIVVASVGARTAANAHNRLVDEAYDAANPRTAARELPTGQVTRRQLWMLVAVGGVAAVVATFFLNWLCVALLPVAALLVGGYSYTKRFTWLCHYWLGATVALAPMGALLGVAGHFEARFFVLAGSIALWVAGFDILYATQDIAFDRRSNLQSIPARFGAKPAFAFSRLSHVGTVTGLAVTGLLWNVGALWWLGIVTLVGLLVAEHVIARGGSEKHLRIASYGLNEIVGVTMLGFVIAAVYTAPAVPAPLLPAGWVNWFSLDVFSPEFWRFEGVFS